jgi:hypothetical protein
MDNTNNQSTEIINISLEIKNIFEKNRLEDLKKFLRKRENLNNLNVYLIYFFHLIQSAGILTTTLAAGYDLKYLVWVGVSLNAAATLINIFEKTNNSISNKLLENITEIKNGNYLDETTLVDPVDDIESKRIK